MKIQFLTNQINEFAKQNSLDEKAVASFHSFVATLGNDDQRELTDQEEYTLFHLILNHADGANNNYIPTIDTIFWHLDFKHFSTGKLGIIFKNSLVNELRYRNFLLLSLKALHYITNENNYCVYGYFDLSPYDKLVGELSEHNISITSQDDFSELVMNDALFTLVNLASASISYANALTYSDSKFEAEAYNLRKLAQQNIKFLFEHKELASEIFSLEIADEFISSNSVERILLGDDTKSKTINPAMKNPLDGLRSLQTVVKRKMITEKDLKDEIWKSNLWGNQDLLKLIFKLKQNFTVLLNHSESVNSRFYSMVTELDKGIVDLIEHFIPIRPAGGISEIVRQYLFFQPIKPQFISMPNVISQHFDMLESKDPSEYKERIDAYQRKTEHIGQGGTEIAKQILVSLGVPQKRILALIVQPKENSILEALAMAWPNTLNEKIRYILAIIPVHPITVNRLLIGPQTVPQHATALLVDLKNLSMEFIDSYGTEASRVFTELTYEIGQYHASDRFEDEDLDEEDLVNNELRVQFEKMKKLALFLQPFTAIALTNSLKKEDDDLVQQRDNVSCVIQAVGNMVGMVLEKEKLVPDSKVSHPPFIEFINNLKIQLSTNKGIKERDAATLTDLAGCMYLAVQNHKVEEDENHLNESRFCPSNLGSTSA